MTVHPAPGSSPPTDMDRRAAAIARWKRRSHVVHFYRRALPIAIVLLVLGVVGWIVVKGIVARMAAGDQSVASIHLTHPRYYGRNNKGEAFVLSASEAVRDGSNPDHIKLTLPHMSLENGAPKPLTVRADQGLFTESAKVLDLLGHVHLDNGNGYIFDSERAHVDTVTNDISGQNRVTGYGPLGRISAASYAVYDKGDRIVFRGNVHTHIERAGDIRAMRQP